MVGNFNSTTGSTTTQRSANTAPLDAQSSSTNNNNTNSSMTLSQLLDIRTIDLLKYLFRLHLALFFFNSKYVSLLHRLTGISYRQKAALGASNNKKTSHPSYKLIASLIALEGVLELGEVAAKLSVKGWDILCRWLELYCFRRSRQRTVTDQQRRPVQTMLDVFIPGLNKSKEPPPQLETRQQITSLRQTQPIVVVSATRNSCGVCLNFCETPAGAATRCGHVFCWKCIINWTVNVRPECPLCRAICTPQEVLALYNW
jgi:peroxin-10